LRPLLGIEAFGVAGWVADAGEEVIVDHTEPGDGQEELYVVPAGRARFEIGDDEQLSASPGTCVGVRPGVRRRATAEADGTSVLAVGAPRGAAYSAPGWEHAGVAAAAAEYRRGDFAAAVTLLRKAESELPDVGGVVYNLAAVS
jgi:quercetin dioxygenase-like cupin family protein